MNEPLISIQDLKVHFDISHRGLVARMLGREHLLSREEVARLQNLRGTYGISAPAPICPPDLAPTGPDDDDPACQVLYAPSSPDARLVPDTNVTAPGAPSAIGNFGEIRLTYDQLTALIDDAVRLLATSKR